MNDNDYDQLVLKLLRWAPPLKKLEGENTMCLTFDFMLDVKACRIYAATGQ